MTRRDTWIPPVLTMVTCGIYMLYWQYVTTQELKDASGREDLNPTLDLILAVLCCGFWSIYVQYRNAQIVHEMFAQRSTPHEDRSTFVLILHALAFVNGITLLLAMMILQDEYNKLADLTGAGGPPVF